VHKVVTKEHNPFTLLDSNFKISEEFQLPAVLFVKVQACLISLKLMA